MKYLFVFVYFGGAVPTTFKQTLDSRHDCAVVADMLIEIYLPHFSTNRVDVETAERLLRNDMRCKPLSGPGADDAAEN